MRKIIASLFFVAILAGCATAGSGKINWDNARQVREGMTQPDVQKLMGQPYQVHSLGDGQQRWVWVHVSTFGGHESAALTFKDGKLLKAFEVPDSFR